MFKRNPDAVALVIVVFLLTVGGVRVGDAGTGFVPPPPVDRQQNGIVLGTGIQGIVASLFQWIPARRSPHRSAMLP
jgi:hypothetical protein